FRVKTLKTKEAIIFINNNQKDLSFYRKVSLWLSHHSSPTIVRVITTLNSTVEPSQLFRN
ncbi:hypothetical protein, partial [Bacillus cereus group sp. BceL294]|uniref:hypothetical protein n=1 Tax=Bacillus cereus group sp. BceL294 TaxID=3444991 RepID=UPI003F23CDAF